MELIVCLKQVVDLQQIRIKKETREPLLEGLPLVFSDMDKNALEESLRIKEKHGGKVTALAVGSAKLSDTIIEALAMGADEAVILTDPLFGHLDTPGTAKVLAKAIQKIRSYDIILLGEGSADNYSGQVGPRLAEILDLPQITYVRGLEVRNNRVRAVRTMEESFEVVEADFPALITVTSEINEPRIPSLTQILKASKKPLYDWKSLDIGMSPEEIKEATIEIVANLAPAQERKGVILEGTTDEVVDSLLSSLTRDGVLRR